MVRKHSDDNLSRRKDGKVPSYRLNYYGDAFQIAVSKLSEENRLSAVVKSKWGYHLIYLVSKTVTKLKDKRDEVERMLKTQRPTPKERQDFIAELRQKARIRT